MTEVYSDKTKGTVFAISFFLGALGVDRMYVGKIFTGLLKLLLTACGGIGLIWWAIDLVLILTGFFKDSQGRKLR